MTRMSRPEAEDFLYREMRLIDERRFDDWLALFTEDCHYWIPCGQGEDPGRVTHLVYDDRAQLEDRVWQMQQTRRWSQSPPSMTTHLVSNVQVEDGPGDDLTVHSSFVVHEVRRVQGGEGEQRAFAGRYEHVLRWEDDQWRIVLKKVWLINRDLPIFSLTFLV